MDSEFLPYDGDAECEIIGSCLNIGEKEEDPFYYLQENDFYTIGSQQVFKAISALKRTNDCNHFTVRNYLAERKQTEGLAVFSNVIHNYYGTEKVKFFLDKLKQKSLERKLIILGDKIQELGKWNQKFKDKESFKDANLLQAETERLLRSLDDNSGIEEDFIESSQLFLEIKQEIPETPIDLPGETTGFFNLDYITGGFQKENLIYLAGRPGMGKTAFAINSILRAGEKARSEKGYFLFYSMEQSLKEIAIRCLSIVDNSVTPLDLQKGNLTIGQRKNIMLVADKLRQLPVVWGNISNCDYNRFENKIRRQMRNKNILGIYIDHMGQFYLPGYEKNKYAETSEIARRLQSFCKEIHVPIICLSQLSRNVENRADKRPVMSDLRESGRIEETAWIILFLYRDDYYNTKSETPGELSVIVAKNKNGRTGEVSLQFNCKSLRIFENITTREENTGYDTPY